MPTYKQATTEQLFAALHKASVAYRKKTVALRRAIDEANKALSDYNNTSEEFAKMEKIKEELKARCLRSETTLKYDAVPSLMAVYVHGRVSWNTEWLDNYAQEHPEIKAARKEGEPYVAFKGLS